MESKTYNIPIIFLNIGLVYFIATVYYFICMKINEDPVSKKLKQFPELKKDYENEQSFQKKNILFGFIIGVSVIFFLKPFNKFW